MRHSGHWHSAPTVRFEPFTNALRIITSGVHHLFTANIAFVCMHNPFVAIAGHTRGRAEPLNTRPQRTGTFGKRLGQLRGINITIIRIPHAAHKIVCFKKRIRIFHVMIRHHVDIQTLIVSHRTGALKFLHPFFGMREPDGSRHVIVHRVVDLVSQPRIKPQRIPLHVHDCPRRGKRRTVACGVPRGPSGQFVFFQQNTISPSRQRKMVKR